MDNNQQKNNRPSGGNQGPNGDPERNRSTFTIFLIVTLVALLVVAMLNNMRNSTSAIEITYDEFLDRLDAGTVESVEISTSRITIEMKTIDALAELFNTENTTYYTGNPGDPNLVERLVRAGVKFSEEIPDTTSMMILNILFSFVVPVLLIWIVFGFVMRRMGGGSGGIMGVGKSRAKVYVQKQTGVTFQDVAGQDEAKESLQEVVDFLENPGKYTTIGAKLPKGALLVGPPGTGKTLLAKAVAGEAKCPFFSLSGSDFVEMFVGVGASRVRDLFEEAKKNAPCIIFIDEIDAIGKSRDSRYGGGNDEREQTLNQLLAEMDGFDTSKGLLVLAATNRPEVLDQALLRPGRFDRRVIVDKPDLKGRVDVLKVHSKNVNMDETVDLEAIALATSGAVGSDLANMINEAAILAVKQGRKAVSQKDLFESVEIVLVGKEKKDRILSKEERRIVSYHEVGHALVSALQKDSEPVQKITIVPRTMGALGYVMNVPEEERYLNTEKEIRAMLVEFVAGRAAEEIVFDTVTTGAANDIEKATRVARAMVTQYGMSKRFGLMGLEVQANQYLDNRPIMNCSDVTAADVDQEVMAVLKESYEEAKRLLTEHRKTLDKIAEFLIAKETITGKEFMQIFREVEGISESDEKAPAARISEKPSAPENSDEAKTGHTVPETGGSEAGAAEKENSQAAGASDAGKTDAPLREMPESAAEQTKPAALQEPETADGAGGQTNLETAECTDSRKAPETLTGPESSDAESAGAEEKQ